MTVYQDRMAVAEGVGIDNEVSLDSNEQQNETLYEVVAYPCKNRSWRPRTPKEFEIDHSNVRSKGFAVPSPMQEVQPSESVWLIRADYTTMAQNTRWHRVVFWVYQIRRNCRLIMGASSSRGQPEIQVTRLQRTVASSYVSSLFHDIVHRARNGSLGGVVGC